MRLRFLILGLLLPVATASAQIPVPQLNLSGNIGCQGFPCVNSGTLVLSSDANHTMTMQETSAFYLKVTSTVNLTATRNLIAPAGRFPFTIENATQGGQAIQIIGPSGLGVTIPNGATYATWNDGTNFVQVGVAIPIPNSALANPSTTVNGQTCTLGSSCTVTTANPTLSSITPGASIGSGGTTICATGWTCDGLSGMVAITTGTAPAGTGHLFVLHLTSARSSNLACSFSGAEATDGNPVINAFQNVTDGSNSSAEADFNQTLTDTQTYYVSYTCGQ